MTEALVLSRGEAENLTKDEVVSKLMRLQKEAGAALQQYDGANLFINYVVAPSVGYAIGEGINMGLDQWAQSGVFGGAWVGRNRELLGSVPHTLIGGGLALSYIPKANASEMDMALFAGGLGLGVPGLIRLARLGYRKVTGARSLVEEQAKVIGQLKAAVDANNAATQSGGGGQVLQFRGPFAGAAG